MQLPYKAFYKCQLWNVWCFAVCAQGQGVLSDKLRSFSMQDLTLINADDELALHTSDPRMRREPMDDMSSGASTLPRARSSAARQSKAAGRHTLAPQCRFPLMHVHCGQSDWSAAPSSSLLFMGRNQAGLGGGEEGAERSHVI